MKILWVSIIFATDYHKNDNLVVESSILSPYSGWGKERQKGAPTSFSPVTTAKVGINA